MKDDLLDRPDLATAEVVLHDLHRGSTEGDIEGVVDAKDSVLETAVRFEASDPESLNLLERLYPNRPAMGPKAVIGVSEPKYSAISRARSARFASGTPASGWTSM